MTEDLNKRVIDLMTDLFNAAAEQSASADSIAAMVEEITRDTVADAVEDAVTDKIGYSEVITEDNFNDWLEDADALSTPSMSSSLTSLPPIVSVT
jgi:PleD family two-component response regulator